MGAGIGIPPTVKTQANNARKFGRVRIQMVKCNLGDLKDVSQAGARVLSRGLFAPGPGEQVELLIHGLDGLIRIMAKVVRGQRLGLFRHELGLSFGDLTSEVRAALVNLARTAPMNECMARCEDRRMSA